MGTPYPVVEPGNKKLTKRLFIFLVRFVEADGHKNYGQSVHRSREDRSHLNNDSTLRLYFLLLNKRLLPPKNNKERDKKKKRRYSEYFIRNSLFFPS
ncbi:hypothetical protein CEXT_386811 [Caerostris extrusa]|uniref:Uncharacterized protein n=1 Tax=Caerostris extrusa TaxID=172846 RepID=A0AAV4NNT4_CAEEX|nr:hypothetical protein CEXT_386811 [Caerostris extrusa]